jgi:hypothetical protein
VGTNDAVEQVAVDPAHVAVNGGQGALDKGPALGVKVLDILVVVVEVGDGNEPVVNPEVGDTIEEEGVHGTDVLAEDIDGVTNKGQANVGEENVESLLGAEDTRGGLKVAETPPALLALQTLGAGRDVEEQVALPGKELVSHELGEGDNGCLVKHLGVNTQASEPAQGSHLALVVLLGGGDKGHVLLHVASVHVVASMAELPAEEGNHEQRVKNPADKAVQAAVKREGAMSALVSQDPDTSADETLGETVCCPGASTSVEVLDLWDVSEGGVEQASGKSKISGNVTERSYNRRLEAVRRNSLSDGVDVWVDGLERLVLHVSYFSLNIQFTEMN